MSFSESLLLALCGDAAEGVDLRELAEAGMVVGADDPSAAPAQWHFRHQLYLDAAYGRLLIDRRQMLHRTLADILDGMEPKPDVAELARHRVAAGDGEKALPLLEQAAREAAAVGAMPEAEAFARAAAEIKAAAAAAVR
jgi:predicted ATPase